RRPLRRAPKRQLRIKHLARHRQHVRQRAWPTVRTKLRSQQRQQSFSCCASLQTTLRGELRLLHFARVRTASCSQSLAKLERWEAGPRACEYHWGQYAWRLIELGLRIDCGLSETIVCGPLYVQKRTFSADISFRLRIIRTSYIIRMTTPLSSERGQSSPDG